MTVMCFIITASIYHCNMTTKYHIYTYTRLILIYLFPIQQLKVIAFVHQIILILNEVCIFQAFMRGFS